MAKKTAKKKTPTPKKAAKRAAPTKNCPKCDKVLHVAKTACDCGYKFAAKKKKRAKKAAQFEAASGQGALSQKLADSIKVVERAGGIDQAKQMLAAVKELEKLK